MMVHEKCEGQSTHFDKILNNSYFWCGTIILQRFHEIYKVLNIGKEVNNLLHV